MSRAWRAWRLKHKLGIATNRNRSNAMTVVLKSEMLCGSADRPSQANRLKSLLAKRLIGGTLECTCLDTPVYPARRGVHMRVGLGDNVDWCEAWLIVPSKSLSRQTPDHRQKVG